MVDLGKTVAFTVAVTRLLITITLHTTTKPSPDTLFPIILKFAVGECMYQIHAALYATLSVFYTFYLAFQHEYWYSPEYLYLYFDPIFPDWHGFCSKCWMGRKDGTQPGKSGEPAREDGTPPGKSREPPQEVRTQIRKPRELVGIQTPKPQLVTKKPGGVLAFVGIFIGLVDGQGGSSNKPLRGVRNDLTTFTEFLQTIEHPECNRIEFVCVTDIVDPADTRKSTTPKGRILSTTYMAPTREKFCAVFENLKVTPNIRMILLHISSHTEQGTRASGPQIAMLDKHGSGSELDYMGSDVIRTCLKGFKYKIPMMVVMDTCFAGDILVTHKRTHMLGRRTGGVDFKTNDHDSNLDPSLRIATISTSSNSQTVSESDGSSAAYGPLTKFIYTPIDGSSLATKAIQWFGISGPAALLQKHIMDKMICSDIELTNGVYFGYNTGEVRQ